MVQKFERDALVRNGPAGKLVGKHQRASMPGLAGRLSQLVAFLNRLTFARKRAHAPLKMLERLGARAAIGPIQKLHGVQYRHRPRRQLIDAADIACRDAVGLDAVYRLQLAFLKLPRQFGLRML